MQWYCVTHLKAGLAIIFHDDLLLILCFRGCAIILRVKSPNGVPKKCPPPRCFRPAKNPPLYTCQKIFAPLACYKRLAYWSYFHVLGGQLNSQGVPAWGQILYGVKLLESCFKPQPCLNKVFL